MKKNGRKKKKKGDLGVYVKIVLSDKMPLKVIL